jgi:hypothetical protein
MNDERTTRRGLLLAGGLAGVVGLSGCLRLTDPGGQSTGGTATPVDADTPAPTATVADSGATQSGAETASGNGGYPPGVSEDGVSSTLVLSHRQAVADTSRTVETQYMFERRTTRIGDAGLLVTGERTPDAFVADGELYQRLRRGSQTIYGYRSDVPQRYSREALTGSGVLRALIEGCNFRPVGRQTIDGETTTLIEADEITDQAVIRESDNLSRYFRRSEFPVALESASGAVTQKGVIRELSAFLRGDGDGGEFLVRTSNVGATSVSKPGWTATAREREAQFGARLVDGGDYIRVEQTAGQTIDAGIDIGAFDGREYYDGEFTGTTSSGSVLFLYKTDEETEYGSAKLGIAEGSRPSSSPAGTWSAETGWNLGVERLRIVEGRRVESG